MADDQIKSLLSSDDYIKFSEKQTAFLLKFKGDLQEMKRRKWNRDRLDYEQGYVYSWSMDRVNNNFQRKPRKGNMGGSNLSNDDAGFLDSDQQKERQTNVKPGGAVGKDNDPGKNKRQKPKIPEQTAMTTRKRNNH